MTGILLVDKPEGMTSAGVIRALKGSLGRAKVGHLGTLDPFASGLLPLCIGEATKIARFLLLEEKAYEGRIRLGRSTDTLDRTGTTVETAPVPPVDAERLALLAASLLGSQRQTPPMFSALKRGGVPLYKLARQGLEVERAPRDITIRSLALRAAEPSAIDFEVSCSKGTYVRVLAADIGVALGTVAHLETLRRTAVGAFRVVDAAAPEALRARDAGTWPLLSIPEAVAGLARVAVGPTAVAALRHGQQAALRELAPGSPGATALVVDFAGAAVGLVEMGAGGWRLVRLIVAG